MSFDSRIAGRVAALTHKVGTSVVYRRISAGSGQNPALSPPDITAPTVSDARAAGATSIDIIAAYAAGRLVAGDKFIIAGNATVYTIGADVIAASNAFASVGIAPGLAAGVSGGEAVSFTFVGDVVLTARIAGFPLNLVNGTTIQIGDLNVIVAGADLSFAPSTSDCLFVGSQRYEIVSVQSSYIKDAVGRWFIQARK